MREAPGALFNTSDLIEVTPGLIAQLKERASASPTGRFRLCLHHDPSDPAQEMIIVHCRGNLGAPHRHPHRSITYAMLEGEMTVVLFDDAGEVTRRIELGSPGSGRAVCFRLSSGAWYLPVARTEHAVFLETLASPNVGGEATEYAPWAPEEEDTEAMRILYNRALHG